MKKITAILALLLTSPILTSCMSYATVASPSYDSGAYTVPSASPSSIPGSSGSILGNLGVLPDTNTSPEEQRLANLLNRKVQVEFPLKVGVLLYRETTNIDDKNRKDLYNNFLTGLSSNPDIALVQEISPTLVGNNTSIEDLRKLAARFQVSTLFIINDIYQPTIENKNSAITPIDIVNNNKNWESYTNIEIFALDILNGVFVASGSVSARANDKYNKDNPSKNKDNDLTNQSAGNAWNLLSDKVKEQITKFKSINGQTSVTPPTPIPTSSPSASSVPA